MPPFFAEIVSTLRPMQLHQGAQDAQNILLQLGEGQHLRHLREAFEKEGISGLFLEKDREEPTPDYDFPLVCDAEAAVYVLSRNSGEGSDRKAGRGDFLLTDCELRDIRFLARHYPRFMLVLNVGGVLDLGEIIEEVPNVLLLSQLGVATGDVLADLLLGKAFFSGKLTTTWASLNDYPSSADFGGWDDTRYREGIFVG